MILNLGKGIHLPLSREAFQLLLLYIAFNVRFLKTTKWWAMQLYIFLFTA
jgi:hypothetical protein